MPFTKDAWGSSQYERNLQMGFNIGGPSLVDIRLVLSKEMMETADDSVMPPKYFALCTDNNEIYYYDKKLPRKSNFPLEVGKFRKVNIQLAGIEDQYGNDLVDEESKLAKIFVAKKFSELINDSDSEGHIIVTDSNFKDYLDQFSTSEEGIFAHVARTGDYNDLKNLPFIPNKAVYVQYFNSDGTLNQLYQLNGGPSKPVLSVKDALDTISAVFTKDNILPFIIKTGDSEIKAEKLKLEVDDKIFPFISFKVNLSDLYNDADFITKAYVDSENARQDAEIAKRQHNLVSATKWENSEVHSRIKFLDSISEGVTYVYTDFSDIAYTGLYDDLIDRNKPQIHIGSEFFKLDGGKYCSDGVTPINDLNVWLKYGDIREYSSEYERLRLEVDSEGGIIARLTNVEEIDLPSKQDNLIAGDNITIDSDGVTINAKDTLYSGGINVEITADSSGELTVINAKDSRYFAGNNITILQDEYNSEDSEGKRYIINAKDSIYKQGFAIEINSEYGVENSYFINVLIDNDSIVLGPTGLRANTAGQIAAKLPLRTQKISDSENILVLDFDSETIIYDSNYLKVNYDNSTIKFGSDGLYVALDNDTIVYSEGVIRTSLIADGSTTKINNNIVSVKLADNTISYSNLGLFLNLDNESLHVNGDGKLYATGKVVIKGDGIKAIPNSEGYIISFNLDSNNTLKIENSELKGNYQGLKGITIVGNTINHTNSIVASNKGNLKPEPGIVTVPHIVYDSEGHIKSGTNEINIYPPTTKGNKYQYFMSVGGSEDGSEGVNVWQTFDSKATENSEIGISSGAVYNELLKKQNKLTAGKFISIDSNSIINSTIDSSESSAILIDSTGNLDVKVDGTSINKDALGQLSVGNSLPTIYTLTLPTYASVSTTTSEDAWMPVNSMNGNYYKTNVVQLDTVPIPPGTSIKKDVYDAIKTHNLPIITLAETADTNSINNYIQWSKIYHVDVISLGDTKKALEFFCYELPTNPLKLNCVVFLTNNS